MPTFMRDDLRFHHGVRGRVEGRPVVLLHGLLWTSRMLERVTALLPDERASFAVQLSTWASQITPASARCSVQVRAPLHSARRTQ